MVGAVRNEDEVERNDSKRQCERELDALIPLVRDHPYSIIIIYNIYIYLIMN